MIDGMYEKMICPETMMKAMLADLQERDPEYGSETTAFEAAVGRLRETVGEELRIKIDAALKEEEQTMGERLIFLFWRGVQQNLECFKHPKSRLFLERDYEQIHQEAQMNQCIPAKPRGFTPELIESLPEEAEKELDAIISYYCYLETVAYKLAHYYGFRFGDRFLPMVVPRYTADETITNQYEKMLPDYGIPPAVCRGEA